MTARALLRRTGHVAWTVLKTVLFVLLLILVAFGVPVPIGRLFECDPPPPNGAVAMVVKRRR